MPPNRPLGTMPQLRGYWRRRERDFQIEFGPAAGESAGSLGEARTVSGSPRSPWAAPPSISTGAMERSRLCGHSKNELDRGSGVSSRGDMRMQ